MGKVLIMVRTSTESQSTEDQKKELIDFCISEGYKRKDIICIEKQGASAAKVDDEYREMIDEVKRMIVENPEIKCYAVWHLNRAFRTEEVYIELKTFFIKHGVQVICKNPYLHLLTPDGKVDPGMELAMGLLAILAKQDNEERKAKFKRAKTSMAAKGKYIGGNTVKFGYKVDENGFFVENEEEGKVIRAIYDEYSTGKYSTYTLAKELQQRGMDVTDNLVSKTLRSKAYIGEEVSETGMHYQPIISKELFDRCAEIRQKNKLVMKFSGRIILGRGLIKCPECGATCTSNSRHYVCCRHSHHGPCSNGFALRQDVADELLCRFAFGLHMMWLMDISEGKIDEYRKELEILEVKIGAAQKKMEDFSSKKERIIETYMEGFIDKKSRDLRLSKVEDEVKVHRDYMNSLEGKRRALLGLLKKGKGDTVENFTKAANTMKDMDKYEIIHKHISTMTAKQVSYGERDPRTSRPNAVLIEITSVYGTVSKHLYFPKFYKGHNLYTWVLYDDESEGWCPDTLNREAVFAQPLG